ncbi:3TM-type holin [Alphaproteobacteria bacterium LSUCC0684]
MGLFSAFVGGLAGMASAATSKSAQIPPDFVSSAARLVDELYTTDDERLDKKAMLARIAQEADRLQTNVNLIEARHRSLFIAGWRPFIGWICGLALAWHFLLSPIGEFLLAREGIDTSTWPRFDLSTLNTVLFGILGLGTLRTAEKAAGKA